LSPRAHGKFWQGISDAIKEFPKREVKEKKEGMREREKK